jgi:uncharacterized membrane protein YciS (DUF1049 family)
VSGTALLLLLVLYILFFYLFSLSFLCCIDPGGSNDGIQDNFCLFYVYIFFYFLSMNVTMLTSFIMTYTICVFFSLLFSVGKRVSSLFFLRILISKFKQEKLCKGERNEIKSGSNASRDGRLETTPISMWIFYL